MKKNLLFLVYFKFYCLSQVLKVLTIQVTGSFVIFGMKTVHFSHKMQILPRKRISTAMSHLNAT